MVSRRDKINQRSSQDRAVSPERIKKVNVEENKRYQNECFKRGFEGTDVAEPQGEINRTLFGDNYSQKGPPSKWPDEDRQKQSIAKKRATDAIIEKDIQGKKPIVKVSVEETAKAKQEIEKDGVDKLWDFLFGDRHKEEAQQLDIFEQQLEPESEEVKNDDNDNDSKKDDGDGFKFFIFF
jgi:hypothetical protein